MNRRKFMQLCAVVAGGGLLGVGKGAAVQPAGAQDAIESFYKNALKEGMAVPFGKHGWLTMRPIDGGIAYLCGQGLPLSKIERAVRAAYGYGYGDTDNEH